MLTSSGVANREDDEQAVELDGATGTPRAASVAAVMMAAGA